MFDKIHAAFKSSRPAPISDEDRQALEAIASIYRRPAATLSARTFVRHDPLTGRAYVHLDGVMRASLERQGHSSEIFARNYEANLRRQGIWPADLPPIRLVRRVRRWSRRGWRVVIGRRG